MKKVFLFSAKIIFSCAVSFVFCLLFAGSLWFAICFAAFIANLIDTF